MHTFFFDSAAGDLYEYDQSSKPAWKKHIQKEGSAQDISLAPSKGCSFHGLNGPTSVSLFLLTRVLDTLAYQFTDRVTILNCAIIHLGYEN